MDTIVIDEKEYTPHTNGTLVPTSRTGPPSQYKPEMCELLIAQAKLTGTQSSWACALGISRQTMQHYRKNHPDFSQAYDIAETHLRSRVEEAFLAQGIHGEIGNTNALKFFAQSTLGMSERQEVHNITEVTVKDQRAWADREDIFGKG